MVSADFIRKDCKTKGVSGYADRMGVIAVAGYVFLGILLVTVSSSPPLGANYFLVLLKNITHLLFWIFLPRIVGFGSQARFNSPTRLIRFGPNRIQRSY